MKEFILERDSVDYCVTIKLREKGLVVYIYDEVKLVQTSIPFGECEEINKLETAIQERKIFIEEKKARKDKEVLRIEVLILSLKASKIFSECPMPAKSVEIIDEEIGRLNTELKGLENE